MGGFGVKGAVIQKDDAACGVQKIKAQVGGDDLCVQVFAPACHVFPLGTGEKMGADGIHFRIQIQRDPKLCGDLGKTLTDQRQRLVEIQRVSGQIAAAVEKIGDFGVSAVAFAGGGYHHKAAGIIGVDDGGGLFYLSGRSKGASAKFDHGFGHGLVPPVIGYRTSINIRLKGGKNKKTRLTNGQPCFENEFHKIPGGIGREITINP